jgi:hypothetical protein
LKGTDVKELAEKYDLPEWSVQEGIERAISDILTKRFGYEVEAMFEDQSLRIYGYPGDRVKTISPESIKGRIKREIKHEIARNLLKRETLKIYSQAKTHLRTVLSGEIVRIYDSGVLNIEMNIEGGNSLIATCDITNQTPKERGKYKEGEIMPFYILRVEAINHNGVPRIDIRVSRTSKGLPEGLLRSKVYRNNIDADIKCVRRIAGHLSVIESNRKLPVECIREVSDELKERIIVRF